MRRILIAFAALLIYGVTAGAWAQEGDVAAGREIAERVCSDCHDVSATGGMKQDPPAFAAIAVYRTEDKILEKIVAPHVGMPRVADLLLRDEVRDVITYIVSLDTSGQ